MKLIENTWNRGLIGKLIVSLFGLTACCCVSTFIAAIVPGSTTPRAAAPKAALVTSVPTLQATVTAESPTATVTSATATPAPVSTPAGYISKAMLGEDWPLTVEDGVLQCRNVTGRIGELVFVSGGKVYYVNGIAKQAATSGREPYQHIAEIWLDHPSIEGLKISIRPLLDAGLPLCTESTQAALVASVPTKQATAKATNTTAPPTKAPTATAQPTEPPTPEPTSAPTDEPKDPSPTATPELATESTTAPEGPAAAATDTLAPVQAVAPVVEVPPTEVVIAPVQPVAVEPSFSDGVGGNNAEVSPPWWPCQKGQIKANNKSGIYHVPEGASYAKTFEDVTCYNTEGEVDTSRFRAAKR